jgi:hypothetical protein
MKGFVPYLLAHASQIFGNQTPSAKLTPPGFLQMLLANKPTGMQVINNSTMDGSGHIRGLKIKYRPRGLSSDVKTTDDCNVDVVPEYQEADVPTTMFRKIGIKIDDDVIRKYEAEASRTVAVGQPASPLMIEMYNAILEQMNGFVGSINSALLTSQAAAFGKNAVTGSNATSVLNFSNTNQISYTDGIIKLLTDVQENEFYGKINICGNGIISAFDMARQFQKGANQAGFDPSSFNVKIWNDIYSKAAWGANQLGVFAENATGLIEIDRYVGSFAGNKGGSDFFTMPIPLAVSGVADELGSMNIDCQLKYVDCPSEVSDGAGGTKTINRGWILYISKSFGLFNMPTDMFKAGDRLAGNNGTLRYTAAIPA